MPEQISPILAIVHRALSMFLCRESGLKRAQAQTGALSVIQRFGSAANLNLHLHCLVFDGVYLLDGGSTQFTPLRTLDDSKLLGLLENIVRRIFRHLGATAVDQPRSVSWYRGAQRPLEKDDRSVS